MNRFGSHPNHENCSLYEGSPPQGLSEALRAGSFFEFKSPIRRGGVPSGAATIIVTDGQGGNNSHMIYEHYDFHRKCSETS